MTGPVGLATVVEPTDRRLGHLPPRTYARDVLL